MTTFTGPLMGQGPNNPTGNSQTDTSGYVSFTKVVPLTGAAVSPRAVITLPPRSILLALEGIATSAFASDVSAMNISWGNSTDATRYGIISVSAVGAVRSAAVSGATDFLNGGTIVIVGSAVSTAVFTAGGAYALARFLMVD